jgi:protein-S-isoprenylcysteine O-methyltransferase Ste14
MTRAVIFLYGLASYLSSLAIFGYLAGFLGNIGVSRSIDAPPDGPFGTALVVNLGLLALFALQHSAMARPAFKRWWTRFVPEPAERSTYMLFTNACLALLFWQWRPMGGVIWDVHSPVGRGLLYTLYVAGWAIVFGSTLLINHFDLFGLRQVWLHLRGRPYTHLPLKAPGLYRHVRHPLYVGWLIVFWATPTMTAAHLLFALVTTAYILVAIQLEERNLVEFHGRAYVDYRRRVPMLIPRLLRRPAPQPSAAPLAGDLSA